MDDARTTDRIRGKTLVFNWTSGPTRGEKHEHLFHEDGSVEYRKVTDGAGAGKFTREKQYGALRIAEDVHAVSYLAASGFTLTVVLNFGDHRIAGFASNDKQWFPVIGTFEERG